MRNNSVRREKEKKLLRDSKQLYEKQASQNPEHVKDVDLPEEFFENFTAVKCPKCSGSKLFLSGGGQFGDTKADFYTCFDCKTEFDIYN